MTNIGSYNTADRLKQYLQYTGLKQIDIVRKCQPICKKYNVKMGRNDINQYIKGRNNPSQIKLSVLAEALNVDEVWLMGYDVPMERGVKLVAEEANYVVGKADFVVPTNANNRASDVPRDELDVLFDEYRDVLTEGDIAIMKQVMLNRKKEIDEMLDKKETD